MKKQYLYDAFERTHPHAIDASIRITDSPENLVAIHLPEVKAVIWTRTPSIEMQTAICQFENLESPAFDALARQKRRNRLGPYLSSNPMGTFQLSPWPQWLPMEIRSDVKMLHGLARKTKGSLSETYKCNIVYRDKEDYKTGPRKHGDFGPHIDGVDYDYLRTGYSDFALTLNMRLIVSYTSDPNQTTEWYPFLYDTNKNLLRLNDAFHAATDPEAFKENNGRQRINPFDVLAFKGDNGKRTGKELLLHNAPALQPGKRRMTFSTGLRW